MRRVSAHVAALLPPGVRISAPQKVGAEWRVSALDAWGRTVPIRLRMDGEGCIEWWSAAGQQGRTTDPLREVLAAAFGPDPGVNAGSRGLFQQIKSEWKGD